MEKKVKCSRTRYQKSLKGARPRKKVSSCVTKSIREKVEFTARRFHCSKSFVVSTFLAHAFGLDVEDFRKPSSAGKRR